MKHSKIKKNMYKLTYHPPLRKGLTKPKPKQKNEPTNEPGAPPPPPPKKKNKNADFVTSGSHADFQLKFGKD